MHTLSDRMLKSGWLVKKTAENSFTLISPLGFHCVWNRVSNEEETPPPTEVQTEIISVETAISEGRISRFLGTSPLLQPPLPNEGALMASYIARQHIAKGHAVLRYRATPDEAGSRTLREQGGAWRVETLLPPWNLPYPSTAAAFSVLLCEHLLDTLPKTDRMHLLQHIREMTPPQGVVYFSVYQMDGLQRAWLKHPFEDGYEVPYGRNKCFIKPYNESMLRRELSEQLHGSVERAWIQFHERVYAWRPHV